MSRTWLWLLAISLAGILGLGVGRSLSALTGGPAGTARPFEVGADSVLPVPGVRAAVLDMGTVAVDEAIARRIILRNQGPQSLRVGQVVSTCPCVWATSPVPDLLPGTDTPVDIYLRLTYERRSSRAAVIFSMTDSTRRRHRVVLQVLGTIAKGDAP